MCGKVNKVGNIENILSSLKRLFPLSQQPCPMWGKAKGTFKMYQTRKLYSGVWISLGELRYDTTHEYGNTSPATQKLIHQPFWRRSKTPRFMIPGLASVSSDIPCSYTVILSRSLSTGIDSKIPKICGCSNPF